MRSSYQGMLKYSFISAACLISLNADFRSLPQEPLSTAVMIRVKTSSDQMLAEAKSARPAGDLLSVKAWGTACALDGFESGLLNHGAQSFGQRSNDQSLYCENPQ